MELSSSAQPWNERLYFWMNNILHNKKRTGPSIDPCGPLQPTVALHNLLLLSFTANNVNVEQFSFHLLRYIKNSLFIGPVQDFYIPQSTKILAKQQTPLTPQPTSSYILYIYTLYYCWFILLHHFLLHDLLQRYCYLFSDLILRL